MGKKEKGQTPWIHLCKASKVVELINKDGTMAVAGAGGEGKGSYLIDTEFQLPDEKVLEILFTTM